MGESSGALAPRILVISGSARKSSLNRKLAHIAGQGAKKAGAEVTLLDWKDYPMPLYDGDLEAAEGLPPAVLQFKQLLLSHQGLLIATPEYNSSITPLLKNAIDWASRSSDGEKPLACFRGKVCALMSTSPGAIGGLRGLEPVRSILMNIGVMVVPEQIAIPKGLEAFDAEGNLLDSSQQTRVEALGATVARLLCQIGV